MKLSETSALPQMAGDVAKLRFFKVNDQIQLPHCRGRKIFLPLSANNEYHPLHGGEQFLFLCRSRGQHLFDCYFGGTDERSAFLTSFTGGYAYKVFKDRGERAFYDLLKPSLVRRYERLFRTKAKRQGDIYAVAIPDWEDYRQAWFKVFGLDLKLKTVDSFGLFYSRHRITGSYTIGSTRKAIYRALGPLVRAGFGKGVLVHPQHSARELDGVHLIMQSPIASD